MEMQAEAERKKRAQILESEGEAEAILARARATAEGLALGSEALKENGGLEAGFFNLLMLHGLRLVSALGLYYITFEVSRKSVWVIPPGGTTMLPPSSASNPANMMAQALTMYKTLLGDASNEKIVGSTPTSMGQIEGNDYSDEAKKNKGSRNMTQHGSPATSTTTDKSENNKDRPMFTLQNPKKRE
ncbi:uncharacterized protein C16G5.07c-like [Neltuma alba]|uniref:uncharacterized protein C16G5.07c-like n=1 Tax=Neltuma alba TaxID=207710 RepID=UPI0010A4434D|nr:uncharacterized protein C16G5.07c-like [Prosopis alba]